MIIVKLFGGLGNQMFQYAVGRRLACIRGTSLKLDISWFRNISASETGRKYELAPFNIHEHFASSGEIQRFAENFLLEKASKLFPFLQKSHIYEKHYQFDPSVLRLPADVYLDGYWQSPKYFQDIEESLRQEFTVRHEPDQANRTVMEEIARTASVSIHVRRGDYISNPATNNFHGICSLEYYRTAVDRVSATVQKPHFFIFSDDPAWAKENLSWIMPHTVIDQNPPDKAYEDMRLMSLCQHHITANSSFSWWGAWLSANKSKVVIAPKQWFKDAKVDTRDLVPKTWKRI